jgi:hypothetical protein
MNKIEIENRIIIKIQDKEFVLNKAEAMELYRNLKMVLGIDDYIPHNPIPMPKYDENYPQKWPTMPEYPAYPNIWCKKDL